MIKTKFVFAVSLVAILAVSSSMAASVTDVAPVTGKGQAISGTTGTVGDVYDWSKWSGYATEGIASVNYVNNAVDAAGNAAQWAENHAAAAGTAAEEAKNAAGIAKEWATEAKNTLADKQNADEIGTVSAANMGTSATTVVAAIKEVAEEAAAAQATANNAVVANSAITAGTATKITYDSKGLVTKGESLAASDIPTLSIGKISGLQDALADKLGKSETAVKATADASGNNIVDTYATKTELAQKQGTLKAGTNITIASDGTISAKDTVYTLPAATANTLGGVKLYTNLGTNQDGTVTQNVVNTLSQEVNSISAKYDNLNDVQTGISSRLDGVESDVGDLVDDKVDIDQGSTNANKIMITNASGGVAPVAITNSGNGSLVTGVSIADGKLTVTKGSSLPTVNNATLTIKNGATNTDLATFTANQSSAATATIPAATPSVAGLSKIGVIPSGSATSTEYATIWVE